MIIRGTASRLPLKDESIHTVVTSPPYWLKRIYSGLPETIWGGRPTCEHVFNETYLGKLCVCGAWKGCLGNEPSPDLFIRHLVSVMDEVWRVLRPDGVCWLNLGDTYSSHTVGKAGWKPKAESVWVSRGRQDAADAQKIKKIGVKDKDLALIPFRFALAMQGHAVIPAKNIGTLAGLLGTAAEKQDWQMVENVKNILAGWSALAHLDGKWVRSVVIWHKLNAWAESVKDRPGDTFEYVFLLTKQKKYFFNFDAVRVPHAPISKKRTQYRVAKFGSAERQDGNFKPPNKGGRTRKIDLNLDGAGLRNVWTFAQTSSDVDEIHTADYPPALVSRCIASGCPERCCDSCGAGLLPSKKTRWKATCSCEGAVEGKRKAVVLDPFSGTGTTAQVAARGNRLSIGLELSPAFLKGAAEKQDAIERQEILL